MPFLRIFLPMVVLLLFCTGCTKGCSESRKDNAVGTAAKPVSSFRIGPAGIVCVSGPCTNSTVVQFADFSSDLARPIDWSNESDAWQVNHDFEENLKKAQEENKLSVSCDTEQIRSLYRTRQRLFFIHRKLTEADERWKDPKWFHAKGYYDLLFAREGAPFNRLLQSLGTGTATVMIEDQGLAADWRLFASELLRYRTMVLSVPDWEKRFDELVKSERNLVSGAPFHEAGFPKTDDACHHLSSVFGGNYIVGYDHGLEGWFYSFWVRRNREGSMDAVKALLEWGIAAVPAAPGNTAEFAWSKSAPRSADEQK